MKPITEYQDYRKYMLDYFEWRKRSSVFSWREFSKIAGFSSPSYLKLVCDGKSSLSRVGVPLVAAAMDLNDFEQEYFKLMVEFTNAKDDDKKKEAFLKMKGLADEQRARVLDADAFDDDTSTTPFFIISKLVFKRDESELDFILNSASVSANNASICLPVNPMYFIF